MVSAVPRTHVSATVDPTYGNNTRTARSEIPDIPPPLLAVRRSTKRPSGLRNETGASVVLQLRPDRPFLQEGYMKIQEVAARLAAVYQR
jgi:dipeptidase